jgi:hypothetical protein
LVNIGDVLGEFVCRNSALARMAGVFARAGDLLNNLPISVRFVSTCHEGIPDS